MFKSEFDERVKKIIDSANTRMKLIYEGAEPFDLGLDYRRVRLSFTKNFDKWDRIDLYLYQRDISAMINQFTTEFSVKSRLINLEIDNMIKKARISIEIPITVDED